MEEYILFGFEDEMEKIALAKAERKKYEDAVHGLNVKETNFKKRAPLNMARFGLSGAIIGGALGLKPGMSLKGLWKPALKGGAVGAGLAALLPGAGHLFWKYRNKDYLKKIPDASLTRGYKGVQKYEKGDKEALNRAVLKDREVLRKNH